VFCPPRCVGSPFRPAVVNPGRVELCGGWDSVVDTHSKTLLLQLHQPFSLDFDTHAAGPGAEVAHCIEAVFDTVRSV